jgi:hypothetical protein
MGALTASAIRDPLCADGWMAFTSNPTRREARGKRRCNFVATSTWMAGALATSWPQALAML